MLILCSKNMENTTDFKNRPYSNSILREHTSVQDALNILLTPIDNHAQSCPVEP